MKKRSKRYRSLSKTETKGKKLSTKEILENKWYDKDLVDSFGQNLDSENNPKLHRCAFTCGISQDRGRDLNISHTPLN